MNVLMVGAGTAGSWVIRGQQLGAALGARVTTDPTPNDWQWADVIVMVKRAILAHGPAAKRSGKPVVWDAVDFWAQPMQNGLSPADAVVLARDTAASAAPVLTICATQAMADALSGVYLPHHAMPGLQPAPARPTCSVVAYQGNALYLGRWAGWLHDACQQRGWQFVINPQDLRDADIVVALRDGPWDGWICREWKSGVKLVNAMAAGRPVITQDSAAWRELHPAGSVIDSCIEIDSVLDHWSSQSSRSCASEALRGLALGLDEVANNYRTILEGVACPA